MSAPADDLTRAAAVAIGARVIAAEVYDQPAMRWRPRFYVEVAFHSQDAARAFGDAIARLKDDQG